MKILRTLSVLILISVTAALSCRAEEYKFNRNIPYRVASDSLERARCVLDIYYPADKSRAESPVVIWFHGGGLTGGDKHLPDELKNRGSVVVPVRYRLIPSVSVAECIDDAAAATAWVFDHIADYGGDRDKIFVSGHSAGGYLTSMIGLDKTWLSRYGVDADSIAGLIPFSGQVITHFSHRKSQGMSELQPGVDRFAPLYHVRKDCPPYVIITGDREQELYGRYEENAYMWRMMKLVGHPQTYIYELDGYNHGDMAAPAFHILRNHIKDILSKR